jgi:hypothetical protein
MAQGHLAYIAFALLLGGCQALSRPAARASPVASFSDRSCADVALSRRADSAVNGYDAQLQDLAAKSAYENCMTLQQGRLQTPAP